MLGYNFSYRGQSFSDDEFDVDNGRGIVLQSLTWAEIVTDDDQIARGLDHGIEVSPTLYRGRLIEIEGFIVANTRSERQTYRDIITETFKLEYIPSPDNRGFYDFTFYDDDASQLKISAKVLNAPRYDQLELGEIEVTKFRVQLIAEDPTIKAVSANSQVHVEGFYGGFDLPVQLPVAMDDWGYIASVMNGGNWKAPLKVTIEANGATGGNMRVVNVDNGEYFGITTAMVDGDILIIDTENTDLTLNGVDVSGARISGSIWPFLDPSPATNYFTVLDDLSTLGDGLQADVTFEWNNTFI